MDEDYPRVVCNTRLDPCSLLYCIVFHYGFCSRCDSLQSATANVNYFTIQSTGTHLTVGSYAGHRCNSGAFRNKFTTPPRSVCTLRCHSHISNMTTSRIVALAKEIEANTFKLDEYLEKNDLPRPSFDADAPLMYQLPPDIAAAQEALNAALDELWWLNQGPIQTIVAKSVSTTSPGASPIFDAVSNLDSLLPRLVSGRSFVTTSSLWVHSTPVPLSRSLRIRPGFR